MHFDKSLIKILLRNFTANEKHYTHYFENCASSFTGKSNRPLLRKYLRYLEQKGYVINYNLGHNIHKWSITIDGLTALKLLENDAFV